MTFCNYINTTGATSGAGTAYPSGAPEFTPVFSGVRVTRSLVSCVCFVDGCLFLLYFFSNVHLHPYPFLVLYLAMFVFSYKATVSELRIRKGDYKTYEAQAPSILWKIKFNDCAISFRQKHE
jgi:hypothetical protein